MLAALLAAPGIASAQQAPEDGWNSPEALGLLRRAIDRRAVDVTDTSLQTYSARGDGYVYFLIDATGINQENLVRTDQVAVDFYWRAPNEVRQRIVGLREQRELPITGLYYYIDRLTVVHDDYGQSIVIADGDNVRDVPHPVGLLGEERYDYRLADSLALRLPGLETPVRVQELEVRPKFADEPAVVGSVFLEAETGAVVRMSFTFTPSSYVDPRLDFINVTLENGLWQGRYWLPHEQRLEIRREMPELELPFGTIIRTRMRIGNYTFNGPVPEDLFLSRLPITFAPEAERRNFPFEKPVDAEWREEGFDAPASVTEIQRRAREMARDAARARVTSGLPSSRLALRSVSDVFRFNRAEGLAVGLGLAARSGGWLTGRVQGGWAVGAGHPVASLDLATIDPPDIRTSVYLNRPAEIGGIKAVSGVANTVSTLLTDWDWSDPYYVSGGSVTFARLANRASMDVTARVERQESASETSDFSFAKPGRDRRPVRPIDDGTHLSVTATFRRDMPSAAGAWVELRTTAGTLAATDSTFSFGRAELAGGYSRGWSWQRAGIEATARVGASLGRLPRQELTLLGGRGTLAGYAYRVFGGSEYAIVDVKASADLLHPWLRARVSAGAGWSRIGDAGNAAGDLLGVRATRELLPAVGIGVGLFYDLLHVDLARGLGSSGETQLIIEFPVSFWKFL